MRNGILLAIILWTSIHGNAVVEEAIGYFDYAQQEGGLFIYEHDFILNKPSSQNNFVRQAGAGFGLGQALLARPKDRRVEPILKRAITGYQNASRQNSGGQLVCAAPDRCTLGGTALALLAEMHYFQGTKDGRYAPIRAEWLKGVLGSRIPGKGFYAGPNRRKESDFFNGESWLALAVYERIFPGHKNVRQVLKEIDTYFIEKYTKAPSVLFYHWAMMAAEERYLTTKHPKFIDFMVSQTRHLLKQKKWKQGADSNACYMVEGLCAVYEVIKDIERYEALSNKILIRIKRELGRSQKLQVQDKQQALKLQGGGLLFVPGLHEFKGAFINRRGDPKARIDTTQHCLSAFLRGEEILRKAGP